jgi:5S rRNA maturation endonuclease (ribonuclease M5)
MITAAELAQRLKGTRSGKGWSARCPGHDDRSASLSIGEGEDGKLLLTCHAGCTFEQILNAAGVERAKTNGQDHNGKARIVAAYDYHDAAGELLFQVTRWAAKNFRQRRPDGNGGWIWNLQGVERVPYRLPELLNASEIYICEGEKDADRLAKLGIVATCNPGGALEHKGNGEYKGKWPDSFARWFDGRHVVILPDNDQAGRDHAEDVARKLQGAAASVKLLELPGLPEKGDASDWLDAGGTVDELQKMVSEAPYWEPKASAAVQLDPIDIIGAPELVGWPELTVKCLPEPLHRSFMAEAERLNVALARSQRT